MTKDKRRRVGAAWAVGAALAWLGVGCGGAQPTLPAAAEERQTIAIVGEDDDLLRELVTRLLVRGGPAEPPDGTLGVLVGAMPDDFPFELPTLEGARVIGSVVQTGPLDTEVIVDAPQPAEAVVSLYVEALEAQGFTRVEPPEMESFVTAGNEGWAEMCRSEDDVRVSVSANEGEGGPTEVRLFVQTNPQYVSCLAVEGMAHFAPSLLPQLRHPPGTRIWGGGGGGGSDARAERQAEIEVEMSAGELAEYYGGQLEEAGWEWVDGSASEYGAWSVWALRDAEGDAWQGALVVIASPTGERRSVRVEVARAGQ